MSNIPSDYHFSSKGWECPKCHAVMSPSYPTCFYCKPREEITSVKCVHSWSNDLYLSNPPKRKCVNCGLTELCGSIGI